MSLGSWGPDPKRQMSLGFLRAPWGFSQLLACLFRSQEGPKTDQERSKRLRRRSRRTPSRRTIGARCPRRPEDGRR
eukprot:5770182-Pyramimonas_sp.AAC.1